MTSPARRLPIFLLVFLLMTWGTCPCVFAKMLGAGSPLDAETAGQPASTAPC